MVTMRDVARAAGVSQAAVSYAFSRPEKLSAAQRERVLQIAEELGYTGPHSVGRTLRTGQVGALGLMVTDSLPYAFDDPATAALLRGIAEVGEVSETALTLLPCPLESERLTQNSGVLLRGLVDGFLAYALPEGHPAVETVLRRRLPVVVIDGPNPGGLPWVGIEDRAAARSAAAHLLALDHRSVGILVDRLVPDGYRGPVTPARQRAARDRVMKERLAGYAAAFRAAGLPWGRSPSSRREASTRPLRWPRPGPCWRKPAPSRPCSPVPTSWRSRRCGPPAVAACAFPRISR